MNNIVEKNRLDWETYSEKYMAFNLSDSMLDAGIRLIHMEEIMPRPDYEHPFFVKNEDIVNGKLPSREEIDAMYDWRWNPAAVLPEMLAFAGRRAGQE